MPPKGTKRKTKPNSDDDDDVSVSRRPKTRRVNGGDEKDDDDDDPDDVEGGVPEPEVVSIYPKLARFRNSVASLPA